MQSLYFLHIFAESGHTIKSYSIIVKAYYSSSGTLTIAC